MISLYSLSKLSADRTSSRVKKSSEKAPDFLTVYANKENLTLQDRLIDACQKSHDNPKGVNELLFISLPERLLAKLIYLALGKVTDKAYLELSKSFNKYSIDLIEALRKQDEHTEYYNLETSDQLNKIDYVLLCGGLSPVDDSIALLAELGRVFRVSKIINKPIKVMLADSEWMSSNKTIRQFKSLGDQAIKDGLEYCRDKKGKLYTNLGIEVDLRQIVHYERKDSINGEKLEKISRYYIDLSKALWGDSVIGQKLDHSIVSLITKPLNNITVLDKEEIALLPEHIRVFSQFPNVLRAIDNELDVHLQILRTIAKQFNIFDGDTFSYFFAQYYAQDKYRGKVLKVAPISEAKFDKPFDELDKYFKTWGLGHSTKDLLLSSSGLKPITSADRISSTYSPQYQIGKYKVLPYTPLSLDFASREDKNHESLCKEMILIETEQPKSLIVYLLKETPLLQRNVLFSDLAWYILLVAEKKGKEYLDDILLKKGYPIFSKQFEQLSLELRNIYENEIKYCINGQINILWKSWFEKIQEDSEVTYIPLHLYFILLDESDWNDSFFNVSATLILSIKEIFKQLILE